MNKSNVDIYSRLRRTEVAIFFKLWLYDFVLEINNYNIYHSAHRIIRPAPTEQAKMSECR